MKPKITNFCIMALLLSVLAGFGFTAGVYSYLGLAHLTGWVIYG